MKYKNCKYCKNLMENNDYRNIFCDQKCYGKYRKDLIRGSNNPNYKGGEIKKECIVCKKEFYITPSLYKLRKHCSLKCRGITYRFTKIGLLSGKKHWNWQGGIYKVNLKDRKNAEYNDWRIKVFKRDNFTCQICGQKGFVLQVNHIKKFSDYEELRFEVENGITLCKNCHVRLVNHHEEEWESYFHFNLLTRFNLEENYVQFIQ